MHTLSYVCSIFSIKKPKYINSIFNTKFYFNKYLNGVKRNSWDKYSRKTKNPATLCARARQLAHALPRRNANSDTPMGLNSHRSPKKLRDCPTGFLVQMQEQAIVGVTVKYYYSRVERNFSGFRYCLTGKVLFYYKVLYY